MAAPLKTRSLRRPPPAAEQVPEAPDSSAVQVMIVDDSLTVRTILKRMVESDPSLKVVDTASSAERAIVQLDKTSANVILLDLEMPGIGGLEALPTILKKANGGKVLVVSSLTEDGAEHTISALSMGAADTMLKPRPGGFNDEYRKQLLGKVKALGEAVNGRDQMAPDNVKNSTPKPAPTAPAMAPFAHASKTPEIIAIGASTGGIHALNIMLRTITPDFDLPILITQHLPASFMSVFARQIEMACARPAVIAEDGMEIQRGQVMIASGEGHLLVHRVGDKLIARLSNDPAQSGCMPSVDPMFSSLAQACNGRVLGIVLSGMGRDGLTGARDLVDAGGIVFAQDADSSAVWGMPGAVTKAGLTSHVAPPDNLGLKILETAKSFSMAERS